MPRKTLAYFVSGFFYMVGLRLCGSTSDVATSGESYDLPRCYRPVPLLVVVPNSFNIIYDPAFGYLIVSSRGMKAILGIGSGPPKCYLNGDGVSMIIRGIAAPSILARPLDIQKYIWI